MKIPTWETSPGALLAFLNSTTQVYKPEVFTIRLIDGTVLRYTSSDRAEVVNGVTFAIGPMIARGRVKQSIGVEVAAMDLTISADPSVVVTFLGLPSMGCFEVTA